MNKETNDKKEETEMNIGGKIKQFRNRLGMTQKQFAMALHVSEGAVGNYETNKRLPSIETLKEIAAVLQVDIQDFFEEEKKSLLQLPMNYVEFRLWIDGFIDLYGWSWLTEEEFEYALKSDRYFVELQKQYLIWLKDGFYLIPVEAEYVDSEYTDFVKPEYMNKVTKSDIPEIEKEVKRKLTSTEDIKLFTEQVYISKYDFANFQTVNTLAGIETAIDYIFYEVNNGVAYLPHTKSYYLLGKEGLLQVPLHQECWDYYQEENIELPYGIYEEKELYVDKSKGIRVQGKLLEELQELLVKERYFINRLFQLVEKKWNPTEEKTMVTFEQLENNIEEWEEKEILNESEHDVIAHLLRFRIWSWDNLKRMMNQTRRNDYAIFPTFWDEQEVLEQEVKRRKRKQFEKEKGPVEHTFLVVDDASFMREMLATNLYKHYSCMVYEVDNGTSAILEYEAHLKQGKPFDIVFLDSSMPGVSGIDTLKKIKELHPESVVIMCSSLLAQKHVLEAMNAGASHFLSKPFQTEKVIKKVNEFLKKETS